jgi:hypothetical protein
LATSLNGIGDALACPDGKPMLVEPIQDAPLAVPNSHQRLHFKHSRSSRSITRWGSLSG